MNSMKKRTLALCLSTLMCLTPLTPINGASDTPASWAVDEIDAAIRDGLVTDTLLSDYDAPITRADFCLSIMHLLESYTGWDSETYIQSKGLVLPNKSPFTDVDDLNVTYAYILGITSGYPDNTFKPTASITRQEAAKMLANVFFALDKDTSADSVLYDDDTDISDWAKGSIALVDGYDIMNGVGNNHFDPQGTYQRQMAILTMNRLYNNLDMAPMSDYAPTTPYHYLVYGLGNAGDYYMTYGNSSHMLYSTEYQKDGAYFARKLAMNMYDEAFVMEIHVQDEHDYYIIPSLNRMVSYETGHDAMIINQMYDAVHHDLLSARISNGAYLFTYGIPFIHDEDLLFHYTFTMEGGDIVHLDKEFNGTTTEIPNINFTFEPLEEAMFQLPQGLEHDVNNWVNDGEWAPFWWAVHSQDDL